MKIYDVTHVIREGMAVFPGDMVPTVTKIHSTAAGAPINLGGIQFGLHTGTHVDSPFHFLHEGKNLDEVELSRFIGKCRVVEISAESTAISRADLEPHIPQWDEILLVKTANSLKSENSPFEFGVAIDISGAEYLVECGVRTIGIDFLSVEGKDTMGKVHHTILGAEMGIIEGLYLNGIPEGEYYISALPLRIEGMEGSPVRAVLIEM